MERISSIVKRAICDGKKTAVFGNLSHRESISTHPLLSLLLPCWSACSSVLMTGKGWVRNRYEMGGEWDKEKAWQETTYRISDNEPTARPGIDRDVAVVLL